MVKVLHHFFNQTTAELVRERYFNMTFRSNEARTTRITTDFFWTCAAKRLIEAVDDVSQGHQYLFDFPLRWLVTRVFGDYHGSEIPLVFGNPSNGLWQSAKTRFTPAEAALSSDMMGYWTRFARKGDPGASVSSGLLWPRVSAGVLDLNLTRQVIKKSDAYCQFWEQIREKGWDW